MDDLILPFQIEATALRGRLVRFNTAVDKIITQHGYPDAVASLLCEAVTLAGLLAGALKYDGVFTLQTKGEGAVRLIVADVTSSGAVRGYAQYDAEGVAAAAALDGPPVPRLLGSGYLAFTVDQGDDNERYQGIVALEGGTLAECAAHYFAQSEQIATGIKLAVTRGTPDAEGKPGPWRAGGIMLQRLPTEGGEAENEPEREEETEDEGWNRALSFLGSCSSAELTDPALPAEDLLFRLFHEDGVRAWPAQRLQALCRCSRERISRVLRSLPREELVGLEVDGKVSVNCEFCSTDYDFTPAQIEALFDEE
ncbi:MAG TPA: Hsp33 family molecular chaperone [Aliidongia sp.]|uniref:Hsp33 family molecular chaperone n=1 Tax=Aliidongia sp. TaxID=1914230 RepID=UPI002DDCB6D5|nr:Hsp33 family molecular chaperone [Aliidongia sp.]HEV2677572.1 Hsp33 family molecular chaperone [Aliidongia sp.]